MVMYIGFCGCDPAQSKSVPGSFSQASFDEIIAYARENYIDPQSINLSRCYAGAADAALKALPYPLMLMPREFYDKRAQLQDASRIIPGRITQVAANDPYVIFIPDYAAYEKQSEAHSSREEARRKALTPQQRVQEMQENRRKLLQEQRYIEDSWEKIGFSQEDFRKVIRWLSENKEAYSKLPPSYTGENPFEKDPFGLHHAYFAAANGFLQSMDPHSGVLDRETWDNVRKEAQDSTFEGIGAMLRGGGPQEVVVDSPLAGSPAVKAGLRAGDIIKKVDGSSIDNLALSEVVKRIRGRRDTIVTLEIRRPTDQSTLTIPIKRGVIVQISVTSQLVRGDQSWPASLRGLKIGVIKVNSFLYEDPSKATAKMMRAEYNNLMRDAENHLDGIILDLRGNPGGFLDEAVDVAGLFLPKGRVVVNTRSPGSGMESKKTKEEPVITNTPVICLINAGSASASEIVASALQDHGVALVLGERSFGKASVQGIQPRGDVLIKLTTQRYYAPRGYTVQVFGVRPDVELSDELDNTFPPRFREEDMWKHLPQLQEKPEDSLRASWVARLRAAVSAQEPETFLVNHKNDAIKPDAMLLRALTYFPAIRANPQ